MAQFDSTVERARATAATAVADAQQKGSDAMTAFRDVSDTMGDALDTSLRTRPYATLVIAAGIGFLLGAAWSR